MTLAAMTAAPPWRRLLAGLVDGAILAGARWAVRRGSPRAARGRPSDVLQLLNPTAELVSQQLGSPGQLLLGLRTVDRRTGERALVWRSLLSFGLGAGAQLLFQRVIPVETREHRRERKRVMAGAKLITERHRHDVERRQAELIALYKTSHAPNVLPAMAIMMPVGVVTGWLSRRISPTVEVLSERRRRHSP
jgi:hypothetical protein